MLVLGVGTRAFIVLVAVEVGLRRLLVSFRSVPGDLTWDGAPFAKWAWHSSLISLVSRVEFLDLCVPTIGLTAPYTPCDGGLGWEACFSPFVPCGGPFVSHCWPVSLRVYSFQSRGGSGAGHKTCYAVSLQRVPRQCLTYLLSGT